jgi:ribosomal protein S18 acetylase RimI-like enzyme
MEINEIDLDFTEIEELIYPGKSNETRIVGSADIYAEIAGEDAWIGLIKYESDAEGLLIIGHFRIDPEFRHAGIGRAALSAFLAAKEAEFAEIGLEVHPLSSETTYSGLLGFYRSLGFKSVDGICGIDMIRESPKRRLS